MSKLAESTSKLIMAAWLGGANMREGIKVFTEAEIAVYKTPRQAIRALIRLGEN